MTIQQGKKQFIENLKSLYNQSEIIFIYQIFIEKLLNLSPSAQKINADFPISDENQKKLEKIISELKTEKPYQQILGETFFYGEVFKLNEHTLIPRPETEELIEFSLTKIQENFENFENLKILDIGTGTGIIPIILKKKLPKCHISSIDISAQALKIAKENALSHQVEIDFFQFDFLSQSWDKKLDIIISNPPYIGQNERNEIDRRVLNFEPEIALFPADQDPLIFYKKIAQMAENFLNPKGLIFLEINQKLGKETLDLFQNFKEKKLLNDLSGNPRFIFVKK